LNFPYSSSTCVALPFYPTKQTCPLFSAPGPQCPLPHLSLCVVNSRPDSFNICSSGTLEDDDELVSAAAQCEAQLNTGVAYDTNIVRMFSDSTKKVLFFKYIFLHNTELYHINRDAFFECTYSKP